MQYEWRQSVKRAGLPVLSDVQPEKAQYRSVYGFPSSTQDRITTQGHMKNLEGMMLYSDMLLIDIDDADNVEAALNILKELGIGYSKWTTGNRGVHIHIPIIPMTGVNVIYSQKHWLQSVGLWSLIDSSIYRPAGQFRAPGARHLKTGGIKTKLKDNTGKLLEIRMLKPPPVVHTDWELETSTPTKEFDFYMNLLSYRSMGGRHPHMYILWMSGKKAGLDREELEDCIRWWNHTCTDLPHSDISITRKIKGFP